MGKMLFSFKTLKKANFYSSCSALGYHIYLYLRWEFFLICLMNWGLI